MLLDEALRILQAFEREGVQYVLVGSIALAVHNIPRATKDIDFMISSDPANVGRIKDALRSLFKDPSIEEIVAEDLSGAYPIVRYLPPEEGLFIDLIARLGDAFSFEEIEWEDIMIEGVKVRVATPRELYRMKRDTMRPQDKVDSENLRHAFDLEDEG